jgi:hypothetical protein
MAEERIEIDRIVWFHGTSVSPIPTSIRSSLRNA